MKLLYIINILCFVQTYCIPILIICKMQNNYLLEHGPYYIKDGLIALDNINKLIETIKIEEMIVMNDNLLIHNQILYPYFGIKNHENLILHKNSKFFYEFNDFVNYIHQKQNNLYIITGNEAYETIEPIANYLSNNGNTVIIYLPGITWISEDNKNNTINKMLKNKNIVIENFDHKNDLCIQILSV